MLVLEARDRVGGRTFTTQEDNGKLWIDLGGSYVGVSQNHLLNLLDELELETYKVEEKHDMAYMHLDPNDERRIEYRSRFSPSGEPKFGNIFHWLDYVHMVRLIDSMGAQIPAEAPWKAAKAREWDSISFKQFVDSNAWTQRIRDYFNNVFLPIDICSESNEVSLLWFLTYVKNCGGYGRSIATDNGGQERKVKNGTQQISIRLRDRLGHDRVLLNKPVHQIDQSGDQVLVSTLDGSSYSADQVILAISPHLWLKIHFEPALPSAKNLLAQRSPMGSVGKVILYYEKPFWLEKGFSGTYFIDSTDRCLNPVILTLDETKPDGSYPAIIGFCGARGCYAMRDKSDEQVGKIVAKSFANATQLPEFLDFKFVRRYDWTNEQYSGGCYTSTHGVNVLTKYGPYLREPFKRIYFAGTETAIEWSGYMDGAIGAGKRAAREILFQRGQIAKELVWQKEPESKTIPYQPFVYPKSYSYAPSISKLLNGFAHLLLVSGVLTFIAYRRLCTARV